MSQTYTTQDTLFRWLSVLVTAFSGVFILMKNWDLESTQVIIIGFLFVLAGTLLAGSKVRSWLSVFALFFFGFYLVARGAGYIDIAWFRFIVGPGLLLISFTHFVQLTKPTSSPPNDSENKSNK